MNRLHNKLYDIAQEARAQDRLQAKRRRTLKRAGERQIEDREVQESLPDNCVTIVDFQHCRQNPDLDDQAQINDVANSPTSLSSWTILRAQFSLLKKPRRNWQEYRQGQRAQEKSERMLRAYDHVLNTKRATSVPNMPPRVEILWFDKPDSGLGLALDEGDVDRADIS